MSSDTPNFASILDAAPTEVSRPKPVPTGTYLCVVTGAPRYDKSSKKQTDFVEFQLRPINCFDDVDEEDLEAAGGIDGKMFRATFYLTEDAVWRLDEFHTHCGLDLDPDTSRRSRNDDVINSEVLVYIKHSTSQDGQTKYAEIARTAPVPEED